MIVPESKLQWTQIILSQDNESICVYLTAVVMASRSYYPSIWHPSIPYNNLINLLKVHICLSSMHPTTVIDILGLLPEVTERCYQVKVIYQISLIKTDFYTYSPVKLLFDGFVPRKKLSELVRDQMFLFA